MPEKLGEVSLLFIAGSFRRPPLVSDGMAYALDVSGSLIAFALHPQATGAPLAHLPPATAFNRPVLAEVAALGPASPGACLLAAHPAGIDLVVLATGDVSSLYKSSGATELAVNPQGSSAGFRAIAVTGALYAFAERAPDSIALALRGFASQSTPVYPLVLSGREVLGPVCCQSLMAFCTESEVGVYDCIAKTPYQVRLPRGFEPLLARRAGGINVAPGAIPMTAERTAQGPVAWVAGSENNRAGMLWVEMSTGNMQFEPASREASLASNPDGSLSLAAEDMVRFFGSPNAPRPTGPLQPGFPAILSSSSLVYFGEERRPGQHRLARLAEGATAAPAQARFEDALCTEATCCAPLVSSAGIAVPYLVTAPEASAGLKLALWSSA